ncbi:tRNA uridine(34) 5-carboxymethylaminomethyl modification radical SAM/GNAT enzyme Elp3 [Candidatus Woesearchaeota archaeon]|nr:tRNA uridine(34) 5-carboxymethylaminomethyl modification radical SAM/GNAT enzyme Elp3 [Candidatus Woesearchaeota archaeon]
MQNLETLRKETAKRLHLNRVPKNIELGILDPKLKIKTKPTRTISGVAPVAIMTEPASCPHGKCIFCPGGPNSFFGDIPMSYTGNEPASMRAIRNKYDPYLQVFNRLEHYILLNQTPEKVELIIMGGTFPSYKIDYQNNFITYALKAMNDFSELFFKNNKLDEDKFRDFFEFNLDFKSQERQEKIHKKLLELKNSSTLEKEQLKNETSKIRCIAMVVETKPDWCFEKHINQMLELGVTRVEIGVQTLNDDILKKVNRGHTLEDSKKAIQLVKDSGLKCIIHMMPGLIGSTKEEDINNFREIFENPDYKPDGLKIYPCMVMPGTPLHILYKHNKFKPITTQEAGEIIKEGKKFFPTWTRVYRIQRDIPTKVTIDGVNITNFRQYIHQLMEKENLKCNCIRCKEPKNKKISWNNIKLKRIDYESSNGKEVFLSYEDTKNDILLGFLRLRIPFNPFRKEITKNSSIIREIHIYGQAALLGEEGNVQHKGLGTELLKEAEKIAKEEFKKTKMLIISGIGVKEYFKKFNYKKDGVYVSKNL